MDIIPVTADDLDLSLHSDLLETQNLTLVASDPLLAHVNARFGFPAGLFDELVFLQCSHKIIRAASRPLQLPLAPQIDRTGIDFLRIDMANPRMTTSAMMTWGRHATSNAVDTNQEQCLDYLRRLPIDLTPDQLRRCTGRGFVIVRHLGYPLGVGFLESTRHSDQNCGHLRSMYPSAFAADLEQTTPFGNPS